MGHPLEGMELVLPALRPLRLVFVSAGVVAARGKRRNTAQHQTGMMAAFFFLCTEEFMRSLKTFSHHSRTPPAASSSGDLGPRAGF